MGDRDGVQQLILPISTGGLEEEQTARCSRFVAEGPADDGEDRRSQRDPGTRSLPWPACGGEGDPEDRRGEFRGCGFSRGEGFIERRQPWIICEILPWQKIDPVTQERSNNNEEVVELIIGLRYDIFALTDEGYFRMTAGDFSRPRDFKDFLLTPPGKIPREINYFSRVDLETYAAA